jgi:putative membrane protein
MLKPFLKTIGSILILSWLLPNISYTDWLTLIIFAIVLTIINSIIKPILKLLTLPINLVTLGLFSILLNAFLLWLALYLVPGFAIQPLVLFGAPIGSFFTLVLMSALIGTTQSLLSIFL